MKLSGMGSTLFTNMGYHFSRGDEPLGDSELGLRPVADANKGPKFHRNLLLACAGLLAASCGMLAVTWHGFNSSHTLTYERAIMTLQDPNCADKQARAAIAHIVVLTEQANYAIESAKLRYGNTAFLEEALNRMRKVK